MTQLPVYSQVLFFGVVQAPADLPHPADVYDSLESGLLDGGFEIGQICFDSRDPKPYDLDTGLYVGKNLGAQFVVMWEIKPDGLTIVKAYTKDGVLLLEKEENIMKSYTKDANPKKPKTVAGAYFKFGKEFTMSLKDKL